MRTYLAYSCENIPMWLNRKTFLAAFVIRENSKLLKGLALILSKWDPKKEFFKTHWDEVICPTFEVNKAPWLRQLTDGSYLSVTCILLFPKTIIIFLLPSGPDIVKDRDTHLFFCTVSLSMGKIYNMYVQLRGNISILKQPHIVSVEQYWMFVD